MTDLAGLFACPRCDKALDNLHCTACRVDYPLHGGVPWLFADPAAAVSEWKNRWQLAMERMKADLSRVERALENAESAPTRKRLKALARGYRAQSAHLAAILQPLHLAGGASLETLLALRTRLPTAHGILSYDANVHRDWNWGGEETQVALDAVLEMLGEANPQRILVLGAGAGRLAYDLHQHTRATRTVALDLNPLLVYVGQRVSRGETLHMTEFPLAPVKPESAAIERPLLAPNPARSGLHFVLADALRPPFPAGAFDLVVTPWLLDVIDEPAGTVLRRINVTLAPGGLWINQGSVAFDGPDPAERLTLEELVDVAAHSGFADLTCREQRVSYMDCPDSRHGRIETVVTMLAAKSAPVNAPPRRHNLPDWITAGRCPIPDLEAFRTQAMTTRIHAYIMSLIDGKRTLQDMARILEEQRLMPRQDAETALRGFLVKMCDEADHPGGL